ncbi:MAG: hypothetical protein NT062_39415 [Proteobacteria bacterium]|nr:hypothetical protein [Pseudomonadota bacterium]
MLGLLAPLVSLAVVSSRPVAPAESSVRDVPRLAQVRLAETLAAADSIAWVRATGAHTITFAITRRDHAYRVVAQTDRLDVVTAVVIDEVSDTSLEPGNLAWLGAELTDATAVRQLAADEDGAIVIVTSDERRYMAIPGRGSGGNAAVEARWAASWDTDNRR